MHQLTKNVLVLVLLVLVGNIMVVAQLPSHDPEVKKTTQVRKKVDLRAVPIDEYNLRVAHVQGPITIDGVLDEPAWLESDSTEQFYQNYPFDTGYAANRTVVRIMSDGTNLYISAACYDELPGMPIATSLNRDWSHRETDGFQWIIDPFLDKTNGFGFAVSAYNAQREGLISNGGNGGINTAWDNKWYSQVTRYPDRWVMEAAIPYKSLRFKGKLPFWRFNFARIDYKRNELSVWVPMLRNFSISNLGYTGRAHFDKPVEGKGSNISIIPYVSGIVQNDFLARKAPNTYGYAAGADAKVGLTSALNLDATVNPDFSQVEVDRQVTNLSRFEIFFPERRNFFLENQDLFDNYGSVRARSFFSRRIGLVFDTSLGLFVNNPIWFGSRVSGKLDQNWRLGVLTTQTANNPNGARASQNTSMVSIQRRVLDRSYVALYGINRQGFGTPEAFSVQTNANDFYRNTGAEFNLVTPSNRWNGKVWGQLSQRPGETMSMEQTAQGMKLAYGDRTWYAGVQLERVGTAFRNEMGFTPRTGYTYGSMDVSYTHVLSSGPLASHGPSFGTDAYWMPDLMGNLQMTDYSMRADYYVADTKTRSATVSAGQDYVYLFNSFDPTNSGRQRLEAGTAYTTRFVSASAQSDMRKSLYGRMSTFYGGYFNGTRATQDITVSYRYMPFMAVGLAANYTHLSLPEPWGAQNLWLLGPDLNLTLTDKVFFRCNYQYNSQINNMNLNARFQWRYLPASDLFVVFTQNYFISEMPNRVKNSALVVKLSYWFNA